MEKVEVEMLTAQYNYAVVRLPERKFPGVVFQGDSLSILVDDICALRDSLSRATSDRDVKATQEHAALIADHLLEVQKSYETALSAHGIRLPYVKRG